MSGPKRWHGARVGLFPSRPLYPFKERQRKLERRLLQGGESRQWARRASNDRIATNVLTLVGDSTARSLPFGPSASEERSGSNPMTATRFEATGSR